MVAGRGKSDHVDRKIIVAVDFGTTYSGLAWAQSRKPEVQTPIIQWPDAASDGLKGATSDKVPTEIRYDDEHYKWGFQIGEFGPRHRWFKLQLDPSQLHYGKGLEQEFPEPMASHLGKYQRPEQLVKDYLTALRQHAEQVLRQKLPQSALAFTPLEFIITVPAVWSDAAKAKTRTCAEQAGMGVGSALHIISEPEAAAMYALDAMDPHDIKVGDTFVLCDGGGGTVDLISYKVMVLKPVLNIVEAAPGSGSLCGSTFLNRIFQKFLEEKLGDDENWDNDVLEEAMQRFDTIVKRSFSGSLGEKHQIPVPGIQDNPQLGVRRGRMRLTGGQVRTIFDPVVKQIIDLVKGQILSTKTPVKAILLVGGFGQNAYLRDCIRGAVGKVKVMQSPNGWTAVVRGALMKGLNSTLPDHASVKITGRSARKHYGIYAERPFRKGVHDIEKQFWDSFSGKYVVNTIDWFIKKGEIVRENKPKRLYYVHLYPLSEGPPLEFDVEIMVCNDTISPKYINDRVHQLVRVTGDFSKFPDVQIPTAIGADMVDYYRVEFAIEITHFSAYTKYELVYRNVNYGPVTAEYV